MYNPGFLGYNIPIIRVEEKTDDNLYGISS